MADKLWAWVSPIGANLRDQKQIAGLWHLGKLLAVWQRTIGFGLQLGQGRWWLPTYFEQGPHLKFQTTNTVGEIPGTEMGEGEGEGTLG